METRKEEHDFEIVEKGGVCTPAGFKAAGISADIKESGEPDLAIIFSEKPASFSGAFTTSKTAAAPVILCRESVRIQNKIRALTVNSGNANACTGKRGIENARLMRDKSAAELGVEKESVLVCSTGKIGTQLPMDKISEGIEKAAAELSENGGKAAAKAIMTTDTVPKQCAVSLDIGGKKVSIGGIAKGAGMIAPRMKVPHATLLSFITTDIETENSLLAEILAEAVENSFNRITIDGDMSTNDSVIVMANGASGVKIEKGGPGFEEFRKAFDYLMQDLAKQLVKDGEGVTKFVTVEVEGAASASDAEKCARAVAESLLCQTAWFGEDPNWGRIVAAAGYSGAEFELENLSISFDGTEALRNGEPADINEEKLCKILERREFTINVKLNAGKHSYRIWTNDISYEYVKINAEYHT